MEGLPFEVIDSPGAIDELFKPKEVEKIEDTIKEGEVKEENTVNFNEFFKKEGEKDKAALNENEGVVEKETEKTEEVEQEKKDEGPGTFGILYNNFKTLGLIESDDEIKPEEVDEVKFLELYEKTLEKRDKVRFDEFAKNLPEEATSLINHLRQGGSVEDFIETTSNPLKNIDIEKTDHQERIISEWLKLNGYTPDEIKSEIEDITDLGKTKVRAERYLEKYNAFKAEQAKELETQREEQERETRQSYSETIQKISDIIDKNENVFDIAIGKDPKKKQEIKDYFTKRNVMLPTGQLVTKHYADQVADKDNLEAYIAKGILTMQRYKLGNIKSAANTKAALTLKEQLENNKKTPLIVKAKGEADTTKSTANLDWNNLFGQKD